MFGQVPYAIAWLLFQKDISYKYFSYVPLFLDKTNWFALPVKICLQIIYGQIAEQKYKYVTDNIQVVVLGWDKNTLVYYYVEN